MPFPLAHHVDRARSRAAGIGTHAEHDLLRERDPDLLVMNEFVISLQRLDRSSARSDVQAGFELEAVPLPYAAVTLRPQLRPGPKQREIDVEQNGFEHATEDSPALTSARSSRAGGRLCRPGGQARHTGATTERKGGTWGET